MLIKFCSKDVEKGDDKTSKNNSGGYWLNPLVPKHNRYNEAPTVHDSPNSSFRCLTPRTLQSMRAIWCKYVGELNITDDKIFLVEIFFSGFARTKHIQNNYPYLCDKGMKDLSDILHRLGSITPPKVMVKLFNTVVKPILIHDNNVWFTTKTEHRWLTKPCCVFVDVS